MWWISVELDFLWWCNWIQVVYNMPFWLPAHSFWWIGNELGHVCASVSPMGHQFINSGMDFHEIWCWGILLKCTYSIWLKSGDSNGHFIILHICVHLKCKLSIHNWIFIGTKYILNKNCLKNEAHVVCPVHFSHKSYGLWGNWMKWANASGLLCCLCPV